MEEQGSTHSYQKSESYPSPRSHSSQSLQDTNSTSPEQKQEGEQKPQGSQDTTKAMSLTFSTEISNSASLDSLPVSKTTNGETLEQNGIQIPNEMHREQHMSTQISEEHQQQLCRSSAVASTTAVLAATQPTTNPQLNHPALSLNAYLPHSGTRTGSQMTINHTPQAAALRYSLTPHGTDERIMTGSRSRKEIKRRTKTGCLTCRKRRIKCDEAHPICRNCQKSKRECLGYDPIFKQQPGPPQIQPAPSFATPTSVSPNITVTSSTYTNNPQAYSSANSNSSYPPDSSVDTALAIVEPPPSATTQPVYTISHPLRTDTNQTTAGMNGQRPPSIPDDQVVKAKTISMDELLVVEEAGVSSQPNTLHIEPSAINEIKLLYLKDYAPGLDKFLETSWYSTYGLILLLRSTETCGMFTNLIKQFRTISSNDYNGMRRIASMEARLVWNLAGLPRLSAIPATAATDGSTASETTNDQLSTVKRRLKTLEALLTNNVLDLDHVPELAENTSVPPSNFYEIEFWRNLGLFAATSESISGSTEKTENALNSMRNVLGQLENRDVLYSIAVARYYGLRVAEFPNGLQQAFSADDSDRYTKLYIAKHFIEQEAIGKGTTQVIQRFCGLAVRSWSAIRV